MCHQCVLRRRATSIGTQTRMLVSLRQGCFFVSLGVGAFHQKLCLLPSRMCSLPTSGQRHFPLYMPLIARATTSNGLVEEPSSAYKLPLDAPPLPVAEAMHRYYPSDFPTLSASRRVIRRRQVSVNGKTVSCGDAVGGGDTIAVQVIVSAKQDRISNLRVLYEDDYLAVVNKPRGVPVHGTGKTSLAEHHARLLQPTSCADDELPRPVHAHRLDAPVGGLLVVCKTNTALREMTRAFEERRVTKLYRALLLGRLEGEGSVMEPVDGKDASTSYRVLETTPSATFGTLTTVHLEPRTGRKHQLRQHMAFLGTPILGDIRYGPDDQLKTRGLFLYALGLSFDHPVDRRPMSLSIEEPEIFGNTRNMERRKAEAMQTTEGGTPEADALTEQGSRPDASSDG